MGKLFLLIGLTVLAAGATDAWYYFHPEAVRSMSCTATSVTVVAVGGPTTEAYVATASAKRDGEPDWSITVGYYPLNTKGRHKAEEACSKWMDEAHKRVMAAQHIK